MNDASLRPTALDGEDEPALVPGCPKCGGIRLAERRINSVFWKGEDVVIIRGIPALACGSCGEDFVSDATVVRLDRMKGEGFGSTTASSFIRVPVFEFGGGAGE